MATSRSAVCLGLHVHAIERDQSNGAAGACVAIVDRTGLVTLFRTPFGPAPLSLTYSNVRVLYVSRNPFLKVSCSPCSGGRSLPYAVLP